MIGSASALVLCGGESRRMGGVDKGACLVNGQSMLARVVGCVQPLFSQVVLSTDRPRGMAGLVEVVQPAEAVRGPLAGVVVAVPVVTQDWLLVVACDMPLLSPQLLVCLADLRGEGVDAVVPVVAGVEQPLCAFYHRRVFDRFDECLRQRQGGIRRLLQQFDCRYVDEGVLQGVDPGLRSFCDVDTPEVLRQVQG